MMDEEDVNLNLDNLAKHMAELAGQDMTGRGTKRARDCEAACFFSGRDAGLEVC